MARTRTDNNRIGGQKTKKSIKPNCGVRGGDDPPPPNPLHTEGIGLDVLIGACGALGGLRPFAYGRIDFL